MRLSQLVDGFPVTPPDADPDINGITEDSRRVGAGTVFVAIPGTSLDGHAYISEAVKRGAAAIVAERTGTIPLGVPVVRVPSSRAALAVFAARYYGTANIDLSLIGFTGTFGKTSTSEMLRAMLEAGGERTAVLGSLGARYGGFHDLGTGLTTPAPVELHRALRGLANAGATTVIMEVTSHALKLGRVEGLRFDGGLVAAIMPGEHTDFHRSYEDYVEAKRRFLAHVKADALLAYDADNLAARRIVMNTSGDEARGHAHHSHDSRRAAPAPELSRYRPIGFSLEQRDAEVQLCDVRMDASGATFALCGGALGPAAGITVRSPLLGRAHVRNLGLALTYAIGNGLAPDAVQGIVSSLTPLRRRMERYDAAGRTVLDDSAAHPDSIRATFEVAAQLARQAPAVVYAVRGHRGAEINRQNAIALADLCSLNGVEPLIVTSASDCTGPSDAASAAEIDATRQALVTRGRRFAWHDMLDDALTEVLDRTRAGDLIVLIGAQGMDDAKKLLTS
jgi:UDP-N-acetylmuramoyl-L-alanyl-D-glutamate--2,6-diaminopimelate ligase